MRTRRRLRLAQYGFTVAAVLALGYGAALWVNSRLYQAQAQAARQFDRELRLTGVRLAAPPVSVAASIPEDGGLVGRLEIPRLGLSAMVVEGDNGVDLGRAVGHIPGTAFPGQPGNVGLAGHRNTFFQPLQSIRESDTITFSTLQGDYSYRVVSTTVVRPQDVQVLLPTERDSLTLVTCFPFDYVGAAPKRFIVRAERSSGT
jgi:sortase A